MTSPASTAEVDQLKRALLAMRSMRERIDRLERARTEPIAVIGIGLRFPGGSRDPESFWQLLRDGVDAISPIPQGRWDVETYFSADASLPGRMPSRFGGFIDDVDLFDAGFFGISPREAATMDPQQRLMLEIAWESLEDAGQAPGGLRGSRTGVFIGMGLNDYGRLQIPRQAVDPTQIENYFTSGNALCITANRISYALDLHGPSIVVDTACSSSLVAVHLACQSLRSEECGLALVGGVNLMLAPATSISLAKFLAPDGRCKAFDARADGYVRAEGAAMVVLKPLSKAISDGDSIYAVIRGSSVNQDGYSSGLTVPNGVAQQSLLREALENAGVKPERVDYIEAHGTGTALGDPIEANAIGAVFGPHRDVAQALRLGSVKTNIGHLEAAAGIAGFIKVALALERRVIPPSLHFDQPNPLIPFEDLALHVQHTSTPWPVRTDLPMAGVSSFGFGGVNAHVVLEAAPPREQGVPVVDGNPRHLLALSARTGTALVRLAERFAELLAKDPATSLNALCASASMGRSHFAHRLAVVAPTTAEARERLQDVALGKPPAGAFVGNREGGQAQRIAFLFTGQGAQSVGMGRGLYKAQPVFRAGLDRCAEVLAPYLDQPLLEVLYPAPGQEDSARLLLDQTVYTQPALFAVEFALSELWQSWGIKPAVVLGHSVGELVAACVAGVFTLEDGLALVAARGRLMQALPAGGAMMAIFAEPERVLAALAPFVSAVSVAAINGPQHTVISGTAAAVESVAEIFRIQGVRVQSLLVSHAFHSPLLDPMLDDFEGTAAAIQHTSPRVPLVSALSGAVWKDGSAPDAAYWRRHAREAVQFAAALGTADALGARAFVEIGPHPVLLGMARDSLVGQQADDRLWLPSMRRGRDDTQQMLDSLGQLYVGGASVDWAALNRPGTAARVRLPTYPFERERYWFKQSAPPVASSSAPADGSHPLLGRRLQSPALSGLVYESTVGRGWPPFLDDHRLGEQPVFPAAAYVEVVYAAAGELFGGRLAVVDELVIQEPLVLPWDGNRLMQVVVAPRDELTAGVQIFSKSTAASDTEWRLHAAGTIRSVPEAAHENSTVCSELGPSTVLVQPDSASELSVVDFYTWLGQLGLAYGPAFRGIEQLWRGEGEALGRVRLPADTDLRLAFSAHPAMLDACLQVSAALFDRDDAALTDGGAYVPVFLEGVRLHHRLGGIIWSHVKMLAPAPAGGDSLDVQVRLLDESGSTVLEIARLHLRRASPHLDLNDRRDLYEVLWKASPAAAAAEIVTPDRTGRWLIFADPRGAGEALAQRLRAEGAELELVQPGHPEDIRALVQQATHVVHMWSLGSADDVEPTPASLRAAQELGCESVLKLVQALAVSKTSPRLWLVTRGAQAVVTTEQPMVAQTPLLGLARTLRLELPSLRCVAVDLDPSEAGDVASLCEAIGTDDGENEVAYRAGVRQVPRLVAVQPPQATVKAGTQGVALRVSDKGVIDQLELVPTQRVAPGPGQVEVRVRAAGLNFRDVLKSLALYPGEQGPLGDECTGTITAIGTGVRDRSVGEEVLGIAFGSLGTYVTTDADLVVRRPAGLEDVEAATLPIAYATAGYALQHLAELQRGERVLIHAAAGGVGLAAVRLALLAGAEVFATAGSEPKRSYLRQLGIHHIYDSRNVDFADQILLETTGRGVDVVLNSLTGDFIPASLAALKNGGRFVEIGKRGIWEPRQVAELGRDIQYFVVYLGGVCQEAPATVQALLRSIVADIEAGALHPLPVRSFAIGDSAAAFRFMAQAKHIGKIALVLQPPGSGSVHAIRPDASYLITGGLSGLGLQVGHDLVKRGGRHLVLVGRGEPGHESRAEIDSMVAQGAVVRVMRADVGQRDEVERVLAAIQAEMPPLRGVVHAAGVLEDAMLPNQNWPAFERVLSPKLQGTWHLHTLTAGCDLDFFVLFSAGATLLGSPGQANYGAANAFLDGMAHLRHAQGLPGLSINWGPWGDVGMAAALGEAGKRRLAARGFGTLSPQQGLDILHDVLWTDVAQIAVLPMDWAAYARSLPGAPGSLTVDLVSGALASRPGRPAGKPRQVGADLLDQIAAAPRSRRRSLVLRFVREQAGIVLDFEPSRIDPRQPLNALGLDSLMAVELRNALATSFAVELSVTLLFDYPTVDALTGYFLRVMSDQITEPPAATGGERSAAEDELDQLSEDELEQLLLSELASGRNGR